ncbi:hypothetical protein FRC03_010392 [Tulasnella sp. 419]|nr:hypothetical protein FRC03_010392 [Tulasnella sp. 419]
MATGPRWMNALSKTLAEFPKSTIYTLSTVNASADPPIPHARSIVHRSFISRSEDIKLLVSTTDIRTPKIHEIRSIQPSNSSSAEIVWWIKESSEQYRFNGVMHILPHPDHPLAKEFPRTRLSPGRNDKGEDWDWEKERIRIFDEKMGPELRASFARPTPGTIMGSYEEADKWVKELPKTGEVGDDDKLKALIDVAVRNFALLVLEPIEVEWLELGVVPNRRTKYKKVDGGWEEAIVVP